MGQPSAGGGRSGCLYAPELVVGEFSEVGGGFAAAQASGRTYTKEMLPGRAIEHREVRGISLLSLGASSFAPLREV